MCSGILALSPIIIWCFWSHSQRDILKATCVFHNVLKEIVWLQINCPNWNERVVGSAQDSGVWVRVLHQGTALGTSVCAQQFCFQGMRWIHLAKRHNILSPLTQAMLAHFLAQKVLSQMVATSAGSKFHEWCHQYIFDLRNSVEQYVACLFYLTIYRRKPE